MRYFWGIRTIFTARVSKLTSGIGATAPTLQASINPNILLPSNESEESICLRVSKLVALMWHVMSMVGHPLTFYLAFVYIP